MRRQQWQAKNVLTRAEALAFTDRMGGIYATGSVEEVLALFFDDSTIRNRRSNGYQERTKATYGILTMLLSAGIAVLAETMNSPGNSPV